MSKKCLKITLDATVTDKSMRKLEHYTGIEFLRGDSKGGVGKEYVRMIGDETLLATLPFHNQIKVGVVKNAATQYLLNQTNWNKAIDGGASDVTGTDESDVMQIFGVDADGSTHAIYAVLGGSDPTYERYIVSDRPFTYGNDEAIRFDPFASSPDMEVVVEGKSRSIRNELINGSSGALSAAVSNLTAVDAGGNAVTDAKYGDITYGNRSKMPTTLLSRYAFEGAARQRNDDVQSYYPYAPANCFDLELLFAFMAIEFRSKFFNKYLGHGISMIQVPNATTWGTCSGIRYSRDGGATWTYGGVYTTFGYINGVATNLVSIMNGFYSQTTMMEPQFAVSAGGDFESVVNSDGAPIQGLSSDVMTGIWTKRFRFNANVADTAEGTAASMLVEAIYRVPVWRGRSRLWGNNSKWTSGYEVLKYSEGETVVHELYKAKSIEQMTIDSDNGPKEAKGEYAFESAYDLIGRFGPGTGWATGMLHTDVTTAVASACGAASFNSYEGAHLYYNTAAEAGYVRKGCRVGGSAVERACVLRYAGFNDSPANAYSNIGSGFRVSLA